MTVSSKLKIKVQDRPTLYYGKFNYRVNFTIPELYWTGFGDDIVAYREGIQARLREEQDNPAWYNTNNRVKVERIDYDLIEKFLDFRNKYKKDKQLVTLRQERDTVGVFTSDTDIVKEVQSLFPYTKTTHVVAMPQGVLYFKKDPPAKYRVYFKSSSTADTVREDLREYLARTPDVVPNTSLERALRKDYRRAFFHNGQYLNYNDDRNLVMMHLMFPGILGKSYKLEKK